jgi:hypothetical protein
MRLSVLSALARMNVDPWEEAARLATLPARDAERSLVSTLNLFPGKRQRSAETEILAGRLVALLPEAEEATTAKAATIPWGRAQRNIYWLVWLCFAIAMSFQSPNQPATTASVGDSASTPNASPPTDGSGAEPAPPDVYSQPDLVARRPTTTPSAGLTAQ